MLNKRIAQFHEMVWNAAARVGRNAARITDDIMRMAFPRTVAEAEMEGADKMLRTGIIEEVKTIVRGAVHNADAQSDFADLSPAFKKIVNKLSSKAYLVPSREEYVDIPTLIRNPELLDEARRFMRQKGVETLEEAKWLDRLYKAVVAD